MTIRSEPEEGGSARFIVKSRLGPFRVEWHERPFEWVEEERFGVRRILRSGPLAWLEVQVDLSDREGGGTTVLYRMTVEPKRGAVELVLDPMVGAVMRQIETAIRRIDERLFAGAPPPIVDTVREDALAAATRALETNASARARPDIQRLVTWIRTAPDYAARRLRPFELADEWGSRRRDVLELCLAAVVSGMLELSWSIVCPSCRTDAAQLPRLSELGEEGHCDLCDLSFGVDFDRAVEATFAPAASIREVPDVQFCAGGPAMMPHVLAQAILPPRGTVSFVAPAEEKRYRLFARGGAVVSVDVRAGLVNDARVKLGASQFDSPRIDVAPGAELTVVDDTGLGRHLKLERLEWASQAATAFDVTTVPAYRRRFSGDVLRPGASMKIGRATVLFSDLSASTELYTREGDAAAFRLVQDHFDLLLAAIGAHDGAVVKTIGDAVMAAFVDEVAAFDAAVEMLRAWPSFVADREEARGVALKIGIYAGPCYAVTANGILDYFGQTVNIAARLQGQAERGEIVVTTALAERIRALDRDGLTFGAPYPAELKGLDRPIDAVRVTL